MEPDNIANERSDHPRADGTAHNPNNMLVRLFINSQMITNQFKYTSKVLVEQTSLLTIPLNKLNY